MTQTTPRFLALNTAAFVDLLRVSPGIVSPNLPIGSRPGWGPLVARTLEGSRLASASVSARLRTKFSETPWRDADVKIDDTPLGLSGWFRQQRDRHWGKLPSWVSELGRGGGGFSAEDTFKLPVPLLVMNRHHYLWNATDAFKSLEDRGQMLSDAMRTALFELIQAGKIAKQVVDTTEPNDAAIVEGEVVDINDYVRRNPVLLCSLQELSEVVWWLRTEGGRWAEAFGGNVSIEAITTSLATWPTDQPLSLWLKAYRHIGTRPTPEENTVLVLPAIDSGRSDPAAGHDDRHEACLAAALAALPPTYRIPDDVRRELLLSPNRHVREQVVRRLGAAAAPTHGDGAGVLKR